MSIKNKLKGASADSIILIFVRLVTTALSFVMTRLLSQHLSVLEYGTYSQVMLLISTISSLTILGMMDGVNFFFCKEKDEKKRDAYLATIFSFQYIVSIVAAIIVFALTIPICNYFDNADLKKLIIFAAVLPLLQNLISLLQILFVAVGKAKALAVRNLVFSFLRLIAILIVCYVTYNIATLFLCTILMDVAQIVYFRVILIKNGCKLNLLKSDFKFLKEIIYYCVPMAMATIVNSLNRDCDKYIISAFTDTETLAIYSNASRLLPFDIIMTAFCTVLLPYVTKFIAEKRFDDAQKLYKAFLEITYISTTILACGVICAAPEVMQLLYTQKYLSGVNVFVIYIIVDIVRFLGITLILSASGKTKYIMFISVGSLALNFVLNITFYLLFGVVGPAIATLMVTIISGLVMSIVGFKAINSSIIKMYDFKYLLIFIFEILLGMGAMLILRNVLLRLNLSYIFVLLIVCCIFVSVIFALNIKRFFRNLSVINKFKL